MTRQSRKTLIFMTSVVTLIACVGCASQSTSVALAVTNIAIIDVRSGAVRTEMTLVIESNRIKIVGHSNDVAIPDGTEIVNGSGKYVIPGLMDMHVHLFNNVSHRPDKTWAFPLFIANGVTGVREMWTASMATIEQWRRGVSNGELLAPRVLAAGGLVDGPGSWWSPSAPEVTTPEAGRRFVRDAANAGMDFIKVYSLLAPEVYRAITDEARHIGIPVAGHIPLQISVLEALQAGQLTNEHLYQIREACTPLERQFIDERRHFYTKVKPQTKGTDAEFALLDKQLHRLAKSYDEQICLAVARALAAAGQWQIPTLWNERRWFLGISSELTSDARLAYITPDERAWWREASEEEDFIITGDLNSRRQLWETTLRVVDVLARSGVGIMVGTDFGGAYIFPGYSVHKEMEMLVEAGLTPLHALQAATINPARYLGETDSLGTVEAGKLADLVILSANPLEDIRNTQRIHAVILNGRFLDRGFLDNLLKKAEAQAN